MCRMIGITNFDFKLHKDILDGFFLLASEGNVPPKNSPGHLDGWGIGYYDNGKGKVEKSGGSVIKERKRFFSALKRINRSEFLIVHLRKSAWEGTTSNTHSHPFIFQNSIFAHNGTVYDFKKLLKYTPKTLLPAPGALDTEVFFRYLLNSFPAGFKNNIGRLTHDCGFSSLNFLFCDGKMLYAYRRYSKWRDYYTLYSARSGNSSVISSEKILDKLNWRSIAPLRLLKYPGK